MSTRKRPSIGRRRASDQAKRQRANEEVAAAARAPPAPSPQPAAAAAAAATAAAPPPALLKTLLRYAPGTAAGARDALEREWSAHYASYAQAAPAARSQLSRGAQIHALLFGLLVSGAGERLGGRAALLQQLASPSLSWQGAVSDLCALVDRKWAVVSSHPRQQLIAVARHLLQRRVPHVLELLAALHRQVVFHDRSSPNLWLHTSLMSLFASEQESAMRWIAEHDGAAATSEASKPRRLKQLLPAVFLKTLHAAASRRRSSGAASANELSLKTKELATIRLVAACTGGTMEPILRQFLAQMDGVLGSVDAALREQLEPLLGVTEPAAGAAAAVPSSEERAVSPIAGLLAAHAAAGAGPTSLERLEVPLALSNLRPQLEIVAAAANASTRRRAEQRRQSGDAAGGGKSDVLIGDAAAVADRGKAALRAMGSLLATSDEARTLGRFLASLLSDEASAAQTPTAMRRDPDAAASLLTGVVIDAAVAESARGATRLPRDAPPPPPQVWIDVLVGLRLASTTFGVQLLLRLVTPMRGGESDAAIEAWARSVHLYLAVARKAGDAAAAAPSPAAPAAAAAAAAAAPAAVASLAHQIGADLGALEGFLLLRSRLVWGEGLSGAAAAKAAADERELRRVMLCDVCATLLQAVSLRKEKEIQQIGLQIVEFICTSASPADGTLAALSHHVSLQAERDDRKQSNALRGGHTEDQQQHAWELLLDAHRSGCAFTALLVSSLAWPSHSQQCLWTLIHRAHLRNIPTILEVTKALLQRSSLSSEATIGLAQWLEQCGALEVSICVELLPAVLAHSGSADFCASVVGRWVEVAHKSNAVVVTHMSEAAAQAIVLQDPRSVANLVRLREQRLPHLRDFFALSLNSKLDAAVAARDAEAAAANVAQPMRRGGRNGEGSSSRGAKAAAAAAAQKS